MNGNELKYLVVHCTASRPDPNMTGIDVMRLHRNVFGWSRVGYRSVVRVNGIIDRLVRANLNCVVEPEEATWGAGAWNAVSHHICYIGGIDDEGNPKDTRTAAQKKSLRFIVEYYLREVCSTVKIVGHNQLQNKACPSFWVPAWAEEIGVPESNIEYADPFGYKKIFASS